MMKEGFLNIAKNTTSILPFIWMYYAPAHVVMLFLLLIICWDTILGIKASKRTGRKITSSRFNDLFAKIFSYTLFIGIGILIGNEFEIKSAYFFASLPAFYSELKSIDENQKTLGREGIFSHFSNTWKMILNIKKERDKLNRNDGNVIVIASSTNAVNTDTNAKFCVFKSGTNIQIKNRLGATKIIKYELKY